MNLDGPLRIEVTHAGKQSTLGKIIELMQRAEQAKPPITQMLERYMGGYLCLVLLIAAIVWFVSANCIGDAGRDRRGVSVRAGARRAFHGDCRDCGRRAPRHAVQKRGVPRQDCARSTRW